MTASTAQAANLAVNGGFETGDGGAERCRPVEQPVEILDEISGALPERQLLEQQQVLDIDHAIRHAERVHVAV